MSIVVPVVSEGTASNRVDDDKEDEEDNVYDRDLLPVILDIGKDPCLARLAVIAEDGWIVLPCSAVWITRRGEASRFIPNGFTLVGEVTCSWRLAASRLHKNNRESLSRYRRTKILLNYMMPIIRS